MLRYVFTVVLIGMLPWMVQGQGTVQVQIVGVPPSLESPFFFDDIEPLIDDGTYALQVVVTGDPGPLRFRFEATLDGDPLPDVITGGIQLVEGVHRLNIFEDLSFSISIEEYFRQADDLVLLIAQTGRIPDGDILLTVEVLDESDFVIASSSTMSDVRYPTPPLLILPDQEDVLLEGQSVTFMWEALPTSEVPLGARVEYELTLAERDPRFHRTPEEALTRPIDGTTVSYFEGEFARTGNTISVVHSKTDDAAGLGLKLGTEYAWQVQARVFLANGAELVGIEDDGFSEVWTFTYGVLPEALAWVYPKFGTSLTSFSFEGEGVLTKTDFGLEIADGPYEGTLLDENTHATFAGVILNATTEALQSGEISFDAGLGLQFDMDVANGALSGGQWYEAGDGLQTDVGVFLNLPAVTLDAQGIHAAANGTAEIVHPDLAGTNYTAAYTSDLTVLASPVRVMQGHVTFFDVANQAVARLDATGFSLLSVVEEEPIIAVDPVVSDPTPLPSDTTTQQILRQSRLLPNELALPSLSLANLTVSDGTTLFVDTVHVGVSDIALSGTGISLALPVLPGSPTVAVDIDQLVIDGSTGTVLSGTLAADLDVPVYLPNLPLAVQGVVFDGSTLHLKADLALGETLLTANAPLTIPIDEGQQVELDVALSSLGTTLPLVPGSEQTLLLLDQATGSISGSVRGGGTYDVALQGTFDVGGAVRTPVTLSHNTQGFVLESIGESNGGVLDFGDVRLHVDAFSQLMLRHDATSGFRFVAALESRLEAVVTASPTNLFLPYTGLELRETGFHLPLQDAHEDTEGFQRSVLSVDPFSLTLIAFRHPGTVFNWYAWAEGEATGLEPQLDFEARLTSLGAYGTSVATANLTLQQATLIEGAVVGPLLPYTFSNAQPGGLQVGPLLTFNVGQITGVLSSVNGVQNSTVQLTSTARINGRVPADGCTAPSVTLTLAGTQGLSANTANLALCESIPLELFAASFSDATLQLTETEGTQQATLVGRPAMSLRATGTPVASEGAVTLDLMATPEAGNDGAAVRVIQGTVDIQDAFEWTYWLSSREPFTFTAPSGQITTEGIRISGTGALNRQPSGSLAATFEVLQPTFDGGIRSGQVRVTEAFALRLRLAQSANTGALTDPWPWSSQADSTALTPVENALVIQRPNGQVFTANGLIFGEATTGAISFREAYLPQVDVAFDDFVIGSARAQNQRDRVVSGIARFARNGREEAILDATGFHGDSLSTGGVPLRIGLPDAAFAYLLMQDAAGNTLATVVQQNGVRILQPTGATVPLYLVPPKAEAPLLFDASLSGVVVDNLGRIINGTLSAVPASGNALDLTAADVPLALTNLQFTATPDGRGATYRLEATGGLVLPRPLADAPIANLDITDGFDNVLAVSAEQQTFDNGAFAVTVDSMRFGKDATPNTLHATVTSTLFQPSGGTPAPFSLRARMYFEEWRDFEVATPLEALPMQASTFVPANSPTVVHADGGLGFALSGVLMLPQAGAPSISLDSLRIGTDGVRPGSSPTVAQSLPFVQGLVTLNRPTITPTYTDGQYQIALTGGTLNIYNTDFAFARRLDLNTDGSILQRETNGETTAINLLGDGETLALNTHWRIHQLAFLTDSEGQLALDAASVFTLPAPFDTTTYDVQLQARAQVDDAGLVQRSVHTTFQNLPTQAKAVENLAYVSADSTYQLTLTATEDDEVRFGLTALELTTDLTRRAMARMNVRVDVMHHPALLTADASEQLNRVLGRADANPHRKGLRYGHVMEGSDGGIRMVAGYSLERAFLGGQPQDRTGKWTLASPRFQPEKLRLAMGGGIYLTTNQMYTLDRGNTFGLEFSGDLDFGPGFVTSAYWRGLTLKSNGFDSYGTNDGSFELSMGNGLVLLEVGRAERMTNETVTFIKERTTSTLQAPTAVEDPDGSTPTDAASEETVNVKTGWRFMPGSQAAGANALEVSLLNMFNGKANQLYFYEQDDGSIHLNVSNVGFTIGRNANNTFAMLIDLRYDAASRGVTDEFLIRFGGRFDLKADLSSADGEVQNKISKGGVVVGKLSTLNGEFSAGFFGAIYRKVPLTGAVNLLGFGMGLFINPTDDDVKTVIDMLKFRLVGPQPNASPAFLALLYGKFGMMPTGPGMNEQIAQAGRAAQVSPLMPESCQTAPCRPKPNGHTFSGDVLVQISDDYVKIDGRGSILGLPPSLLDTGMYLTINYTDGWNNLEISGAAYLDVGDFPVIDLNLDQRLTFYLSLSEGTVDSWMIDGSFNSMTLVGFQFFGHIYASNDGLLLEAGVRLTPEDYGIVNIHARLEGAVWFYMPANHFGVSVGLDIGVDVADGLLRAGLRASGTLLVRDGSTLIFLTASGYFSVASVFSGSVDAWMAINNGSWSGGLGRNTDYEQLIADSRAQLTSIRTQIDETRTQIAAAKTENAALRLAFDAVQAGQVGFGLMTMSPEEVDAHRLEDRAPYYSERLATFGSRDGSISEVSVHRTPYRYHHIWDGILRAKHGPVRLADTYQPDKHLDDMEAALDDLEAQAAAIETRLLEAELQAAELSSQVQDLAMAAAETASLITINSGRFSVDVGAVDAEMTRLEQVQDDLDAIDAAYQEAFDDSEGALDELNDLMFGDRGVMAFLPVYRTALDATGRHYARRASFLNDQIHWATTQQNWLGDGTRIDAELTNKYGDIRWRYRDLGIEWTPAYLNAYYARRRTNLAYLYELQNETFIYPPTGSWRASEEEYLRIGHDLWYTTPYNSLNELKTIRTAELEDLYDEYRDNFRSTRQAYARFSRSVDGLFNRRADMIMTLVNMADEYATYSTSDNAVAAEKQRRLEHYLKQLEAPTITNVAIDRARVVQATEISNPQTAYLPYALRNYRGKVADWQPGYFAEKQTVTWSAAEPDNVSEAIVRLTNIDGSISELTLGQLGHFTHYVFDHPDFGSATVTLEVALRSQGGIRSEFLAADPLQFNFRGGGASQPPSDVEFQPPPASVRPLTPTLRYKTSAVPNIGSDPKNRDGYFSRFADVQVVATSSHPTGQNLTFEVAIAENRQVQADSLLLVNWQTARGPRRTTAEGMEQTITPPQWDAEPGKVYWVFIRARGAQGAASNISKLPVAFDPTVPNLQVDTFTEAPPVTVEAEPALQRYASQESYVVPAQPDLSEQVVPTNAHTVTFAYSDAEAPLWTLDYVYSTLENPESAFKNETIQHTDSLHIAIVHYEIQPFFVHVRAKNKAGLYSDYATLGPIQPTPDATRPSTPFLVAGRPPSGNLEAYHLRLYAPSHDPESGIIGYQWAMGTRHGSDDLRPWPEGATVNFPQITDTEAQAVQNVLGQTQGPYSRMPNLNLGNIRKGQVGMNQSFYVSVRAINKNGIASGIASTQVAAIFSGDVHLAAGRYGVNVKTIGLQSGSRFDFRNPTTQNAIAHVSATRVQSRDPLVLTGTLLQTQVLNRPIKISVGNGRGRYSHVFHLNLKTQCLRQSFTFINTAQEVDLTDVRPYAPTVAYARPALSDRGYFNDPYAVHVILTGRHPFGEDISFSYRIVDAATEAVVVDWQQAEGTPTVQGCDRSLAVVLPNWQPKAGRRYTLQVRAHNGNGTASSTKDALLTYDATAPTLAQTTLETWVLPEPAPSPVLMLWGDANLANGAENHRGFFEVPATSEATPSTGGRAQQAEALLGWRATDAGAGVARLLYAISTESDPDAAFARDSVQTASAILGTDSIGVRLMYPMGDPIYVHALAEDSTQQASASVTTGPLQAAGDVTRPSVPVLAGRLTGPEALNLYFVAPSTDPETDISGYQWALGTTLGDDNVRAWPDSGSVDFGQLNAEEEATLAGLAGLAGTTIADLHQLPSRSLDLQPFLRNISAQALYVSVRAVNGRGVPSGMAVVEAEPPPPFHVRLTWMWRPRTGAHEATVVVTSTTSGAFSNVQIRRIGNRTPYGQWEPWGAGQGMAHLADDGSYRSTLVAPTRLRAQAGVLTVRATRTGGVTYTRHERFSTPSRSLSNRTYVLLDTARDTPSTDATAPAPPRIALVSDSLRGGTYIANLSTLRLRAETTTPQNMPVVFDIAVAPSEHTTDDGLVVPWQPASGTPTVTGTTVSHTFSVPTWQAQTETPYWLYVRARTSDSKLSEAARIRVVYDRTPPRFALADVALRAHPDPVPTAVPMAYGAPNLLRGSENRYGFFDVPMPPTPAKGSTDLQGLNITAKVSWTASDSLSGVEHVAYVISPQTDAAQAFSGVQALRSEPRSTNADTIWAELTFPGGAPQYLHAVARDSLGNASPFVSTGPLETTNDHSRPSIPQVVARLGEPGFINLYFLQASADAEAPVVGYQWALGTTAGADDLRAWPDSTTTDFDQIDTAALQTLAGTTIGDLHQLPTIRLPLDASAETWYLSIRAVNAQQVVSGATTIQGRKERWFDVRADYRWESYATARQRGVVTMTVTPPEGAQLFTSFTYAIQADQSTRPPRTASLLARDRTFVLLGHNFYSPSPSDAPYLDAPLTLHVTGHTPAGGMVTEAFPIRMPTMQPIGYTSVLVNTANTPEPDLPTPATPVLTLAGPDVTPDGYFRTLANTQLVATGTPLPGENLVFDAAVSEDRANPNFLVDWYELAGTPTQTSGALRQTASLPDWTPVSGTIYYIHVRARSTTSHRMSPVATLPLYHDNTEPSLVVDQVTAVVSPEAMPATVTMPYGHANLLRDAENRYGFFAVPQLATTPSTITATRRSVAGLAQWLTRDALAGVSSLQFVVTPTQDPTAAFANGTPETLTLPHPAPDTVRVPFQYTNDGPYYLHARAQDRVQATSSYVTTGPLQPTSDVTRPVVPQVVGRLQTPQTLAFYFLTAGDDPESGLLGYQWATGTTPGSDDLRAWPDSGTVDLAPIDPQQVASLARTTIADLQAVPSIAVSLAAINLPVSGTWYASLRAVNTLGIPSGAMTVAHESGGDWNSRSTPTLSYARGTNAQGYFAHPDSVRIRAVFPFSGNENVGFDVALADRPEAEGATILVPWQALDGALSGDSLTLSFPLPTWGFQDNSTAYIWVRARNTTRYTTSPVAALPLVYDAQPPTLAFAHAALRATPQGVPDPVLMAYGDALLTPTGENHLGFFDVPAVAPALRDSTAYNGRPVNGTVLWVAQDATAGLADVRYVVGTEANVATAFAQATPTSLILTQQRGDTLAVPIQYPFDGAYYLHAQAIDSVGNRSTYRSTPALLPTNDVTRPSVPTLVGRLRAPGQLALYFMQASVDPESDISGYQWALGTQAGATDLRPWPDSTTLDFSQIDTAPLNAVAGTTINDLHNLPVQLITLPLGLAPGQPWYLSVRAVNGQNLVSGATYVEGKTSNLPFDFVATYAHGARRDDASLAMSITLTAIPKPSLEPLSHFEMHMVNRSENTVLHTNPQVPIENGQATTMYRPADGFWNKGYTLVDIRVTAVSQSGRRVTKRYSNVVVNRISIPPFTSRDLVSDQDTSSGAQAAAPNAPVLALAAGAQETGYFLHADSIRLHISTTAYDREPLVFDLAIAPQADADRKDFLVDWQPTSAAPSVANGTVSLTTAVPTWASSPGTTYYVLARARGTTSNILSATTAQALIYDPDPPTLEARTLTAQATIQKQATARAMAYGSADLVSLRENRYGFFEVPPAAATNSAPQAIEATVTWHLSDALSGVATFEYVYGPTADAAQAFQDSTRRPVDVGTLVGDSLHVSLSYTATQPYYIHAQVRDSLGTPSTFVTAGPIMPANDSQRPMAPQLVGRLVGPKTVAVYVLQASLHTQGIAGYQWALGTQPGAADLRPWLRDTTAIDLPIQDESALQPLLGTTIGDLHALPRYTVTLPNLATDQTWYLSVRAVSTTGLVSGTTFVEGRTTPFFDVRVDFWQQHASSYAKRFRLTVLPKGTPNQFRHFAVRLYRYSDTYYSEDNVVGNQSVIHSRSDFRTISPINVEVTGYLQGGGQMTKTWSVTVNRRSIPRNRWRTIFNSRNQANAPGTTFTPTVAYTDSISTSGYFSNRAAVRLQATTTPPLGESVVYDRALTDQAGSTYDNLVVDWQPVGGTPVTDGTQVTQSIPLPMWTPEPNTPYWLLIRARTATSRVSEVVPVRLIYDAVAPTLSVAQAIAQQAPASPPPATAMPYGDADLVNNQANLSGSFALPVANSSLASGSGGPTHVALKWLVSEQGSGLADIRYVASTESNPVTAFQTETPASIDWGTTVRQGDSLHTTLSVSAPGNPFYVHALAQDSAHHRSGYATTAPLQTAGSASRPAVPQVVGRLHSSSVLNLYFLSASTAPQGLKGYQWAIGTQPGQDDIRPWPQGNSVDFGSLSVSDSTALVNRSGTTMSTLADLPTQALTIGGVAPLGSDWYLSVRAVSSDDLVSGATYVKGYLNSPFTAAIRFSRSSFQRPNASRYGDLTVQVQPKTFDYFNQETYEVVFMANGREIKREQRRRSRYARDVTFRLSSPVFAYREVEVHISEVLPNGQKLTERKHVKIRHNARPRAQVTIATL